MKTGVEIGIGCTGGVWRWYLTDHDGAFVGKGGVVREGEASTYDAAMRDARKAKRQGLAAAHDETRYTSRVRPVWKG